MRDGKFNKALAILLSLAMVILPIAPMETVSAATKTQKAVNCKVCNDTKVCTYCNGTGTVESLSNTISTEINKSSLKLSKHHKPELMISVCNRHTHGKAIKTGWVTWSIRKKQIDKLKEKEGNSNDSSDDSDKTTTTVECSYCKGTKKCSHCCLILTNKDTGKSVAGGNSKGKDFSNGSSGGNSSNNNGSTRKGIDFSNGDNKTNKSTESSKGSNKSNGTNNQNSKYTCSKCEDTGECLKCDGLGECKKCNGEGSSDCNKCFNGECSECDGGYIDQWTTNGIKQRKCTRCNYGSCKYCDGTGVKDCNQCDHGECSACDGSGDCPSCGGR